MTRKVSGLGGSGNFSLKSHYPNVKLHIPLSVTTNAVFEVFNKVAKSEKFQIIEMEHSFATAVYKEPFSIRRMLTKCIPFAHSDSPQGENISAVRI